MRFPLPRALCVHHGNLFFLFDRLWAWKKGGYRDHPPVTGAKARLHILTITSCHNYYKDKSRENNCSQSYQDYENTFQSIILISQTPFYYEKSIKTIGTLKKIGLNINLPAFNVDILKYIVILHVYQKFGTFPMWQLVINSILVRC